MLKKLMGFLLVMSVVLLIGCGGGGGNSDALLNDPGLGGSTPLDHSLREWNFLVYINGDSNLDRAALGVIKEMEKVGTTDRVRVLVLVDRAKNQTWSTTRLYYVTLDTDPSRIGSTLVADYGEKDMSDPDTLRDFIVYCQQNFPANHTLLSVYAHGGGVWPRGQSKNKGIAWDETNGSGAWDCLTTDELAQALSEARAVTSRKMDLIYLDSCIMQMTEVAYEWRDQVDYMVGSEEDTYTVNNVSSNYARMLQDLNTMAAAGQTVRDYAMALVECYHDFAVARNLTTTISAVELKSFNLFFPAFQTFAARLNATGNLSQVKTAYQSTTEFARDIPNFHELHDLYDFADEIGKSVSDPDLIAAADSLKNAMGNVVISHKETGVYAGSSRAYGLSILLPTQAEWNLYSEADGYPVLKLAQDSEWEEFIRRFVLINP